MAACTLHYGVEQEGTHTVLTQGMYNTFCICICVHSLAPNKDARSVVAKGNVTCPQRVLLEASHDPVQASIQFASWAKASCVTWKIANADIEPCRVVQTTVTHRPVLPPCGYDPIEAFQPQQNCLWRKLGLQKADRQSARTGIST